MQLNEPILWILAALASFRLAYSLSLDGGAGDLFMWLRTWLGCYDYGPEQYKNGSPKPRGIVGQWISCPICVSLFPCSFIVIALIAFGWWPVVALLGIAGANAMMFRWRNW